MVTEASSGTEQVLEGFKAPVSVSLAHFDLEKSQQLIAYRKKNDRRYSWRAVSQVLVSMSFQGWFYSMLQSYHTVSERESTVCSHK